MKLYCSRTSPHDKHVAIIESPASQEINDHLDQQFEYRGKNETQSDEENEEPSAETMWSKNKNGGGKQYPPKEMDLEKGAENIGIGPDTERFIQFEVVKQKKPGRQGQKEEPEVIVQFVDVAVALPQKVGSVESAYQGNTVQQYGYSTEDVGLLLEHLPTGRP